MLHVLTHSFPTRRSSDLLDEMEIRDDVPRKLFGGTSPHDLQYPLTTLQPIAMSFPDAIRREKGHEAAIVAAVETIGKGVTKFGTIPFNLHASEVIHKASRYKRDSMSCTRNKIGRD